MLMFLDKDFPNMNGQVFYFDRRGNCALKVLLIVLIFHFDLKKYHEENFVVRGRKINYRFD
jgi:hypothetical protein